MTKTGLYPVNLNIGGKLCVVAGGGKVAERKIKSCLRCGAKIKVVAKDPTLQIEKLCSKGKIQLLRRNYKKGDLYGAYIVIAATNDDKANRRIKNDAEKLRILVNTADNPELCDFTMPAVIRRGNLSIAISTQGTAPFLAKTIRKYIEKEIGKEYIRYSALLAQARDAIKKDKKLSPAGKKKILQSLADGKLLEMVKNKASDKEIKKLLEKKLGFTSHKSTSGEKEKLN